MTVAKEPHAGGMEEASRNQKTPDLSRRGFLGRLTLLGIGCAAGVTLGVREADATLNNDTPGKANGPANDKALAEGSADGRKAVVDKGVELEDDIESSSVRRGVARRQVRRTGRHVRRVNRRVRRRAVVVP